jgi:hypothetical protein
MVKLFNQTSIYIGNKDFKKNFWDTQPFLKSLQPNWNKWHNAWKNRIKHYTPRTKPQQADVDVKGIIEKWNPKKPKGGSQVTTTLVSPMFGPDVVDQYRECNDSHTPTAPIKTADAAEALRKLVALDIKFMIGCDCEWEYEDDAGSSPGPAAAAAGPASGAPLLPPAAEGARRRRGGGPRHAAARPPAPAAAAGDIEPENDNDIPLLGNTKKKRMRPSR